MKKNNIFKKGFTLIELLVVIAIIGILSSVVLAGLNSARTKANNTKVQSQLDSMRNAAEIFYATNNSYGTTTASVNGCGTPPSANTMFSDANSGMVNLSDPAKYPSGTSLICYSSGTNWAASANFATSSSPAYWCVDNSGNSKGEASGFAAASSTLICP